MPTVRKLAEIAGVSIATVSLALRDDPRVREATRKRIQDLAALYNYHPNRLTQSLIRGKSYVIGCMVPDVSSDFGARILRGVLRQAHNKSFRVIVLETHLQLEHSILALSALIEQRVDGIILATGHAEPLPLTSINAMRSNGIHPVMVDIAASTIALDSVHSDEMGMADAAVRYLRGLGHKAIGYIGPRWPRLRAVEAALRRHGLSTSGIIEPQVADPALIDAHEAERLLRECIRPDRRLTAVIALNDLLAAHLLQQADRLGVRIPEDLSVLSYGNAAWTQFLSPALTSIEQHPETIGARACELLLSRISGESLDQSHQEMIAIPADIVPRASCAPPAKV